MNLQTSLLLSALLATGLTTAAWSQTNGLVAHWGFEEKSGSSAKDESGKGNTATLQGATWGAGKVGSGALRLDGTNDSARIASASFNSSGNMTIAAWVMKVTDGDNNWILDMQTGNAHVAFGIEQRSAQNKVCFFNGNNGTLCTNAKSIDPHLGKWVHLAVTRPSGGSGTRIYINGVEAISGSVGKDLSGATRWAIGGAADNATSRAFNGQIDDLRVYNRVLTSSEISQLAKGTTTPAPAPAPTPTPTPTPTPSPSDTTNPTVAITSPSNGATISSTVTVSANASDNVAVSKVEFYINGAIKATDTASPYSYSWAAAQSSNGTYTVLAKAYDAAGNTATATISVTVNANTGSGRQFYVSPSGNDANAGTLQQPWRTIQKAVNTMSAGDTTFVRAGTYNKFVTIGWDAGGAAKNGTASAPITLKAYPGEKAILANDTSFGSSSRNLYNMIDLRGRSYWTIEGFVFSHTTVPSSSMWWSYGIFARGSGKGLVIRNNTFEGNGKVRPGGTVINLIYDFQDCLIENNVFQNWPSASDLMGVTLETDWRTFEANAVPNKNTVIRGNTFDGLGGDGVQVAPWGGYNTLIENNVFRAKYNDSTNKTAENAVDIKRSFFTTIRNNTMSGFRPKNSNPRGEAIVVHLMAEDVLIENNLIYDNGCGITVAAGDPSTALPTPSWYKGSTKLHRITIRRNVILDSNKKTSFDGRVGVGKAIDTNGVIGLSIHHNVFAHSAVTALATANIQQGDIRNNVFYKSYNDIMDETSGKSNFQEMVVGANLFDKTSGQRILFRDSAGNLTVRDLNGFRSATGQAAGSVTGDPMFVSPSTGATSNYNLKAGSPAIDKAVRISGCNDKFNGAAPDMGVFEYGTN